MSVDRFTYQGALREFQSARFQAALRHVLARLTRTSDELLSYQQVAEQLRLSARSDRGIQTIPVAAIVGSVGRAQDFTRDFLPRRAEDQDRWARVRTAFVNPHGAEMPPIEVYQVGQAYFVLDGNHRVSIARREGVTYIDAHVIEIQTSVPLSPDDTPDDLICKAEHAEFLQETGLGDPEFGFDFSVAQCGQYPKLRAQIAIHQIVSGRERGRDVSFRQAAADWLAQTYAPLVRALREQNLLQWFPDHTETDLYLWVIEHQQQLQQELGWAVRTDAAITDLAVRANPRARARATAPEAWRNQRLTDRYLAHLFSDILIPLSHESETSNALEQAIRIAEQENASLHGLHIARSTTEDDTDIKARFRERCTQANVAHDFIVERGKVTDKICERALLTDLIVMDVNHPPSGRLSALMSRWRALLKNAARPILAVPREPSAMQRALLIFDSSPESQQALFIAAYMGEIWKTALTVLAMRDDAQNYARNYFELHELDAEYISAPHTVETILPTLAERNLDMLLIGNDRAQPSNLVNALLRASLRPLLICQ